jgi:hypothetical protein
MMARRQPRQGCAQRSSAEGLPASLLGQPDCSVRIGSPRVEKLIKTIFPIFQDALTAIRGPVQGAAIGPCVLETVSNEV